MKKKATKKVKPELPIEEGRYVAPLIQPLTQDFTSVNEMNVLRDKINEIIAKR